MDDKFLAAQSPDLLVCTRPLERVPPGVTCYPNRSVPPKLMSVPPDTLLQTLPEDSSPIERQVSGLMLNEAFDALPDAVYLFGDDRRLIKANGAAASLQRGQLTEGTA